MQYSSGIPERPDFRRNLWPGCLWGYSVLWRLLGPTLWTSLASPKVWKLGLYLTTGYGWADCVNLLLAIRPENATSSFYKAHFAHIYYNLSNNDEIQVRPDWVAMHELGAPIRFNSRSRLCEHYERYSKPLSFSGTGSRCEGHECEVLACEFIKHEYLGS